MFENAEVFYSYTRKQALEDGVLLDVTQVAAEAGFKYPVAVTKRLWDEVVTPDDESKEYGQSEEGRLWDVLWMCMIAAKYSKGSEIKFQLYVQNGGRERLISLKAVCHSGDEAEPVITIMMPEED
ncbi:MAG: hypothetical protein VR68_00715 [Peptococcaceae bacterium BRH_c4a]|nr:MAG: hypothetical protein VR68_00715 [Peptococcaceae bacterium BRH_c4a]